MAEKQYRQVLAAQENVLGREHFNTVSTRRHLATCLSEQGRHAEAATLFREVLNTTESVRGTEDEVTLKRIYDLAKCLQLDWQLEEAEKCFLSGALSVC